MAQGKSIWANLNISNHGAEWVLGNLQFVFFLGFLGVLYIANAHYAEKKVRQIQSIQKEIKDLRSASISMKAELMVNSKLTEFEKDMAPEGLKISDQEPIRVIVTPKK